MGGVRLRFCRRNPGGERVYWVSRDSRDVGNLYVWPHGGACLFDMHGYILRDLSTEHGKGAVLDALELAPTVDLQETLF